MSLACAHTQTCTTTYGCRNGAATVIPLMYTWPAPYRQWASD